MSRIIFFIYCLPQTTYKPQVEDQPFHPSVLVLGVEVPWFALKINKLYLSCDQASWVERKKWVISGRDYFPWLSRVIGKDLPLWANGIGHIKRLEHFIQDKHWLGFISNRLLLLRNDRLINIERVIIVSWNIRNIIVNLGKFIAKMIKLRSKQLSTQFPFPSLISLQCFVHNEPIFSKIDQNIKCTGMIGFSHRIDEDNPNGINSKASESMVYFFGMVS